MPQELPIDRILKFRGAAQYTPNVEGRLMPEMNILDDHFNSDTDSHDWSETTQGSTIAGDADVLGGAITITTDGSDNGEGEITRRAQWSASKNCGMEASIKVDIVTAVGINVGFVDAVNNTDNEIAGMMDGAAAFTAPSTTADFALFVFDTDDVDVYYCGASNNGTEGTPVAAIGTLLPVADKYARLRVQTDTAGNVTFYYNGTAVGYLPAAIAFASTNLLTPYVAFIERSASARVLTIDRITVWQDD